MTIGHQKQWDFLTKNFESKKISHAYLFIGEKGLGKKKLAKEFIKYINCPHIQNEAGKKIPCQKCFSCQSIEREAFPDFRIISKKEDKNEIEILQIRDAQNFLSYKSYYGAFKAIIIDDAEKMNQEAQSCFLKTLEEPKGDTILFLITSKPDMLLPTIFSRCQILKFFRTNDLQPVSEKLKEEQIILSGLLKVINSDLSEKFKYTKSIDFEKQKIGDILEALKKHFRESLLSIIKENEPKKDKDRQILKIKNIINLIEDIGTKISLTNANPKLALEVLLMEI